MPTIVMTLRIPPEKYSTWRQAVTEMAGPRRAEFDAARRRQGVSRQGVWVVQEQDGPREVLVLEADDPGRVFELMATSQEPFDIWLRELLLDVYKLDLTQPPAGPMPEQLLDWSADET